MDMIAPHQLRTEQGPLKVRSAKLRRSLKPEAPLKRAVKLLRVLPASIAVRDVSEKTEGMPQHKPFSQSVHVSYTVNIMDIGALLGLLLVWTWDFVWRLCSGHYIRKSL